MDNDEAVKQLIEGLRELEVFADLMESRAKDLKESCHRMNAKLEGERT